MTASRCSAISPLMCKGRAEASGPGVWLDPDRYAWLWSDGTGIAEVSRCPFCLCPLPNVAAAILKAMQREPLAEPEE